MQIWSKTVRKRYPCKITKFPESTDNIKVDLLRIRECWQEKAEKKDLEITAECFRGTRGEFHDDLTLLSESGMAHLENARLHFCPSLSVLF